MHPSNRDIISELGREVARIFTGPFSWKVNKADRKSCSSSGFEEQYSSKALITTKIFWNDCAVCDNSGRISLTLGRVLLPVWLLYIWSMLGRTVEPLIASCLRRLRNRADTLSKLNINDDVNELYVIRHSRQMVVNCVTHKVPTESIHFSSFGCSSSAG